MNYSQRQHAQITRRSLEINAFFWSTNNVDFFRLEEKKVQPS